MAKMTSGSFTAKVKGGAKRVSGYLFDLELADGTVRKMGVYDNKADGRWDVIDIDTGLSLCHSTTRKDAVARAESEPVVARFTELVGKMGAGFRRAEPSAEPKTAEAGSLEGERVCITGTLPGMTRSEAFTRLKLAGGVPCEKFSSKVTLLVIAANAGKDKRDKAEKAIAKGQKVRVVSGTEFVKALNEQGKTKREKEESVEDRVKELEAKLKAAHAELEQVWKENEHLKKAKQAPQVPQAPKAPQPPKAVVEAAGAVSLEAMRKWCEGKGLVASQKREGTCIWVEGESRDYADELKEMGFRFAKKRKSWYLNPAA